jgi:hypothetical protein
MRFDPEARREKYRSVVATLEKNGFLSSVPTGKNHVDVALVSHPQIPENRVMIFRRERGWFLAIPGSESCEYYGAPDEQAVIAAVTKWRDFGLRATPDFASRAAEEFGFVSLTHPEWSQGENSERDAIWARFGWERLSDAEYYDVGERFDAKFFPQNKLRLPKPSRTWRHTKIYNLQDDAFDAAEGALTMHALAALRTCVAPGETLLAMDWNHPCFHFDVHRGIRRPYRDEWAMPILHDAGDSHLFLTPGLESGIFGLGNSKLCVFGQLLLDAFLRGLPKQLLD